jgi:F-type H+-transporting ATPase subunit gamma
MSSGFILLFLRFSGGSNIYVGFNRMTYIRILKKKIASYSSLKDITKAIQLVALAKLTSLNYKLKRRQTQLWVIKKIFQLQHRIDSDYDARRYILILVTTDRSCCGILNSNVFKVVNKVLSTLLSHQKVVKLITIGVKGKYFLRRAYPSLVKLCVTDVGSEPLSLLLVQHIAENVLRCDILVDQYIIIYNRYINIVEQRISYYKIYTPYLLSSSIYSFLEFGKKYYSFWASVLKLYNARIFYLCDLFFSFFCLLLLDALEENEYSELGARYRAMDNSHTNIVEMLNTLLIKYHKVRQETITRELIEIISAASCILEK